MLIQKKDTEKCHIEYHSNGKVKRLYHTLNDELHGKYKFWNYEGILIHDNVYDRGMRIK